MLLDSTAPVSGLGVAHDLTRVADRLQIAGDDHVERRSFAQRIGQTKPVFVYKLIAADTVEERILELQDKKGRLAAATLDAGTAVGSLAAEDLDYLFGG